MKSLFEQMEEYDRERIAEINRRDTPEARARMQAKREAENARQLRSRRHTIRTERFVPLNIWGV